MMIDLERVAALIDEVLQSHDELLAAHREAITTAKAALAFAAQMAAERDEAMTLAKQLLEYYGPPPDLGDESITPDQVQHLLWRSGRKPS